MTGRPAAAQGVSPPFVAPDQQSQAQHLGMWVFLVTEVLFFGGLFVCYTVYRWHYPEAFAAGSQHLNAGIGGINTALLLTSSLCVALGDRAIKLGQRRALGWCLAIAWVLGAAFLAIKGHEYALKAHEHLIPGPHFQSDDPHAPQVQLFMVLYFAMTGLHALHMIIGLGALAWLGWRLHCGRLNRQQHAPVEIVGLYWHFVDVVWVFLYPLLYLVGPSG